MSEELPLELRFVEAAEVSSRRRDGDQDPDLIDYSLVVCLAAADHFAGRRSEAETELEKAKTDAKAINERLQKLADAFNLAFKRVQGALPASYRYAGDFHSMELRARLNSYTGCEYDDSRQYLFVGGSWGAFVAKVEFDGQTFTYTGKACERDENHKQVSIEVTEDREVLNLLGADLSCDHPYHRRLWDIRQRAARARGEPKR